MSTTLIIGIKNLSSWSMRPWVLMRHFEIPFEETLIRLDAPETRATIKHYSPSGLVPCLVDNGVTVWDSLAIAEYLADKHSDKGLWPADPIARARARCLAAEMHAGFSPLRTVWPMDVVTEGAGVTVPLRVKQNLDRLFHLWAEARTDYGEKGDGPYLFGSFTIVDAFFAPVVSRLRTYGPVPMDESVKAYTDAIWANRAVAEWVAGAHMEKEGE